LSKAFSVMAALKIPKMPSHAQTGAALGGEAPAAEKNGSKLKNKLYKYLLPLPTLAAWRMDLEPRFLLETQNT
jgi:hypothetical protein